MNQGLEGAQLDEFRRANLAQVWNLYRGKKRMAELAPVAQMAANDRSRLLRHHETADIDSEIEIHYRQRLDKLLHLCGILEAGWCSGALAFPDPPIPAELDAILSLPEVCTYFQNTYPLAHMERFLERIHAKRVTPFYFEPTWFAALLRLDANIRDKKMVDLLLIVDGYWSGEINFRSLVTAVQQREVIIEAITTPRDLRSPLQLAIAGLEAFLLFCDDLQELLDRVESKKELQEAAFDLYRYWFLVRGEELKSILKKAIAALSDFNDDEAEARLLTPGAIDLLFARARDYTALPV